MQEKTVVANDLELAGMIAQYDEHAKRIISNKGVLARILKESAEEFQEVSLEELEQWIEPDGLIEGHIAGNNTEDKKPGEGEIYYDVRFQVWIPAKGKKVPVKLLINIEAQKDFYKKYHIVTRGVFYGARMISSQLGTEFTGSNYQNVRKVYSIWLCMNAPKRIGNAMTEYHLSDKNIVGNMHEKKEHYDKLSVIIICLNEKMQVQEGGIHDFLNVLFSTRLSVEEKKQELESRFDMKMSKELEGGEGKEMCNLGEAIYEEGISQGISKGKLEGEERVSRLNLILIEAKKFVELERASKDAVYRRQLFEKYGI